MAVNKNFVVKQGLEVKQNLLVAEGSTSRIGIGTTAPLYTTHVIGGIGATDLYVSGVSTFSGAIDANGALDVDGHTELDDVNVSGASTFTGAADFNGALDVDGHTELDDVNVSGASTFTGAIDANGALDVDGHTELDDVNVSGVSTLATLGVSIAATTKDLLVTGVTTAGIVTGATYYGDGSNLIGVSTTFTGSIGIQSGGTVIGTGITMVNITGGGSTAWSDTNVATIKLPPAGVSIGLAIALGS